MTPSLSTQGSRRGGNALDPEIVLTDKRAKRPTGRQTAGYHNVKRGCSGSQKQHLHVWKEPENIQGALSSNKHVAKSFTSLVRRSVRSLGPHRVYNGMFVACGGLIIIVWRLSAKSCVSSVGETGVTISPSAGHRYREIPKIRKPKRILENSCGIALLSRGKFFKYALLSLSLIHI